MTARRVLIATCSAAIGVVLLLLVIRMGHIHIGATLARVGDISLWSFANLVLLNGALVWFSTVKWRAIDAQIRDHRDSAPSRGEAFLVSSIGMALGTILPVQLGMSAARTAGTRLHGKPLRRGTAGTLFEQSFDFLTALVIAAASEVTLLLKWHFAMWLISAALAVGLTLLLMEPIARLLRRIAAAFRPGSGSPDHAMSRILSGIAELQSSGVLSGRLARRLLILSVIRFVILALVAVQTASAIGAHIAYWQLAAALPFVTVACAVAITPGGLGVNELSFAAILHLFGTPLDTAATWAVANRLLVTGACFVVPFVSGALLWIQRLFPAMAHIQLREP